MNDASPKSCPDHNTLRKYIQGLLEPPKLDHCEQHVSGCDSCHETLRGLDIGDTLSHHVSQAMEQPQANATDSGVVEDLIQRLLQPNHNAASNPLAGSEILADKAAEVLRCIEPAATAEGESLGSLGNYQLLRLIGAGGTGVVFQAKDTSLDRLVALKVLRPSLGDIARERFIAEARLAASIEHDNVVTIYQIGQQERLAFIAMQWLPGETLEDRLLRESGPIDETTVREFVSQIASGLSAAHQRQLIHRDIKPANIWICDDTGRIKILDFGLARVADEESSLTQTGMLAGTPSYMSPEQTKGMELDPRSDLFSLGCVMYRLLTGRLPFAASSILGTLQTIQSEAPKTPGEIQHNCDPDLSDLTMNLLEKLPGNRMDSAQNLIACLNANRSRWPVTVPHAVGNPDKVPLTKQPIPQASLSSTANWLIALLLLGLLAIPGWLLAPQIFRFATDQGELVIETTDDDIKIELLKNGSVIRVLDAATGSSFDIESGEYSFNVVSDDKASEYEITPNSINLNRGGRKVVAVSMNAAVKKKTSSQSAKSNQLAQYADKSDNSDPTGESPIYSGRQFEEWLHIANNDREPQTVAHAISACGFLADGERRPKFLETLRKLTRKHGAAGSSFVENGADSSPTNIYFSGFAKAIGQLEAHDVIEFVRHEMQHGNEQSLGFCSCLYSQMQFNGQNSRIQEFRDQLRLDMNPLLDRMLESQISSNLDVRAFFETFFSKEHAANADLSKCKALIKTVVVDQRPWFYRVMMKHFDKGEFDQQIESEFFSGEASASTREQIISALRGSFSFGGMGGGGFGGGGSGIAPSINAPLLYRLLEKSILRSLDPNAPALEIGRFSKVWFNEDGIVETWQQPDGLLMWRTDQGSYVTTKPKDVEMISGKAALIRHLLNDMCQVASDNQSMRKVKEGIEAFPSKLDQTLNKLGLPKELLSSGDFLKLEIQTDIDAILELVAGESNERSFSSFLTLPASTQSSGGYGGGLF